MGSHLKVSTRARAPLAHAKGCRRHYYTHSSCIPAVWCMLLCIVDLSRVCVCDIHRLYIRIWLAADCRHTVRIAEPTPTPNRLSNARGHDRGAAVCSSEFLADIIAVKHIENPFARCWTAGHGFAGGLIIGMLINLYRFSGFYVKIPLQPVNDHAPLWRAQHIIPISGTRTIRLIKRRLRYKLRDPAQDGIHAHPIAFIIRRIAVYYIDRRRVVNTIAPIREQARVPFAFVSRSVCMPKCRGFPALPFSCALAAVCGDGMYYV